MQGRQDGTYAFLARLERIKESPDYVVSPTSGPHFKLWMNNSYPQLEVEYKSELPKSLTTLSGNLLLPLLMKNQP
jgi:hypothetical protein